MSNGNARDIYRILKSMEMLTGSAALHRYSQHKNWGPSTGTTQGRLKNKARGATPHNPAAQLFATTCHNCKSLLGFEKQLNEFAEEKATKGSQNINKLFLGYQVAELRTLTDKGVHHRDAPQALPAVLTQGPSSMGPSADPAWPFPCYLERLLVDFPCVY